MELFRALARIEVTHVPYKGTGPSMTAVIGGEVHMLIANVASVTPHVKSGRLRALAVTGLHRSRIVPELPTIAEAGVAGYEFDNWYGLWAPARTPTAIITKVNAEINRALQAADVQARFAQTGIEPLGGSPAHFAEYLDAELKKWKKVARDANIKAE